MTIIDRWLLMAMEKNLKLTIRDEDILEMERIKSLHGLTDDELFSYLLRLDAIADKENLTPTERRHQVERARQAAVDRARAEKGRWRTTTR